ncbi:DUF4365 domain-containing protein [Actinophytocola glycyrrhizae]|uniref:DUF4365 domain-containing protein n=1 Tax=Actinophytocola glycyrrhizae TaxID=2044873 RepID=A0ABV9RXB6_9PSEU
MRQPEERQRGKAGQTAVTLAFERMGWGAVSSPETDVGTDLYLFPTDSRRFDLGLVIGAQVKTGQSWFAEPVLDESGDVVGWWFRDRDRKHVDSWLSHYLPHLLVLHNEDTNVSYWAHITREAVESTGKGVKILVPTSQTVNEANRDALLAVTNPHEPPAWEGSAWTGADHLLPKDLLRHALLVPRVIAPHRNAGLPERVTAEQILALYLEARLDEIEDLSRRPDVPDLTQAETSNTWSWRFVAAFAKRVTEGTIDQLAEAIKDAPNPPARAAATVVAAAALMEHARPDEALVLLDETLNRGDNEPVDHAWLTAQRAQACWDIGLVDDAMACAVSVQELRSTHPNDITATAVAGTAAMLLFTGSAWGREELGQAITGLDTLAVWWRTHRVATGTSAAIEREFAAWSRRRRLVVIDSENVAHNRLLTASLLASHLADHREWRHLESLNLKQALLRTGRASDPDEVRALVTGLLMTGDDKAMPLLTCRLVLDGPAAAVSTAARDIDLAHWTRTTCATTLTLLRHGGDVLDEETASAAARWLLSTLANPQAFADRTRPVFELGPRLVDTLAGLVHAAPHDDQIAAAEFLLGLGTVSNETAAVSLARLARALPASAWLADRADRATAMAQNCHETLRLQLLGTVASVNEIAHQQLIEKIRGGSIRALIALNNAPDVPSEAVPALMAKLESQISRQIADARQLSHGMSAFDSAEILASLNVHHEDVARWDSLYALLEEPLVALSDKAAACQRLTRWADRLPNEVRTRLGQIATAALNYPPTFVDELGEGIPSGRGEVAALAAATGHPDLAHKLLTRALETKDPDRVWAAQLASHLDNPTAVGVLTTLIHDDDPTVRAEAAGNLTQLVLAGTENPLALAALRHCLHDQGTRVARKIAGVLVLHPSSTTTTDLTHELATHRSAAVREAITAKQAE